MYIIDEQTKMRVAMTCPPSMGRSTTNVKDAELMAAAPAMARLLKKLYDRFEPPEITSTFGHVLDNDTAIQVEAMLDVATAAGVLGNPRPVGNGFTHDGPASIL